MRHTTQRLNFRFAAKRDKRLATFAARCVRSILGGHLVIIRICQVYLPNRVSSRILCSHHYERFLRNVRKGIGVTDWLKKKKRESMLSFASFYYSLDL